MAEELLSVFDIAKRLNVHVRTVRNYVRDGRLRAVRVGKQYRISRADLEAFTGGPLPPTDGERAHRRRRIEVSSIVEVDAISEPASAEVEKALAAFVHSATGRGERLKAETFYDRDIGRLKMILLGGPSAAAAALEFLASLMESR
ncbi:MAG TPA: helix-turn-helix domain-containing protein [Gemmatimonadaceae bacterium]